MFYPHMLRLLQFLSGSKDGLQLPEKRENTQVKSMKSQANPTVSTLASQTSAPRFRVKRIAAEAFCLACGRHENMHRGDM